MIARRTTPLGFALLVCLVGCSGTDENRLTVYDAQGTVLIDGEPVAGAKVTFYGATDDLRGPGTIIPCGVTDASGVYRLSSYETEDGAPAGEFNVTVSWPAAIPAGVDEEMYKPQDRLGNRYSNPAKSGITLTVPPGGGELPPLELSAKQPRKNSR